MTTSIQLTGTEDPVEIAAVVAALARPPKDVRPSGYERWRNQRAAALRASRAS